MIPDHKLSDQTQIMSEPHQPPSPVLLVAQTSTVTQASPTTQNAPVEPQFRSRLVRREDYAELQALHDRMFGPGSLTRTAYRVREGMPPQSVFCRVITCNDSQIIASIRFTPVSVGATQGALLLGPLAVDGDYANQGHGRRLISEGLAAARDAGIALVLLVGDTSYYARLGFEPVQPGRIQLPGPFDPGRLLGAHLDETRSRLMTGLVQGAT
jgi:predicted N-acetyltransferase YhbS